MTETSPTPQAGVAEALQDLSDQTRNLVRQEVDAAVTETWAKARRSAPVAALLAAAGFFGLLAAASAYRFSLRLLEKRLPPATAALAATVIYGAGSAGAAVIAVQRIRALPAPLPVQTARQAGEALADVAHQAGDAAARQADDDAR